MINDPYPQMSQRILFPEFDENSIAESRTGTQPNQLGDIIEADTEEYNEHVEDTEGDKVLKKETRFLSYSM